jgi:hypothetical protein
MTILYGILLVTSIGAMIGLLRLWAYAFLGE